MLSTRAFMRALLGAAIGTTLLFLAFQNVDIKDFWIGARSANFAWIFAGMALYAITILLRVERWRRLIRPTQDISYAAVAQALVVGYSVNNLLPARLGEVFRADYISRRNSLARSAALGTIAIERLIDGLIVVAVFIVGLASVNIDSHQAWSSLTTVAVLAGLGLFGVTLLIVGTIRWHARLPVGLTWLGARLAILARSITSIAIFDLKPVFALSLVIWLIEAHVVDCMMRAFGVTLGWAALCVVLGAVSLSTLLPSAPGYVGSLQIAFVTALSAFELPAPLGLLSATAMQIFPLGALTCVGSIILLADQLHPDVPRINSLATDSTLQTFNRKAPK
jgi:uncharacterized membrane protein YbhN (UPF0104 family)